MSCGGAKSARDSSCHPQHIEFSLTGAIELHLAETARHEHNASRPDLPLREGDASGVRIPHACSSTFEDVERLASEQSSARR